MGNKCVQGKAAEERLGSISGEDVGNVTTKGRKKDRKKKNANKDILSGESMNRPESVENLDGEDL